MNTFSLEACQRLAEVLGEDIPKTYWVWGTNNRGKFLYEPVPHNEIKYAGWVYAYRLDDLTKEVWEEIGGKLVWPKPCEGKCWCTGECKKTWFAHATNTHQAWLTGGYPEASKYLIDILQGYGKG